MRIMFFTDTYEPQINGVVTAIKLLERELKKLGHEVYIVCPKVKNHKFPKNVYTCKSFTFKPYPEYKGSLPSLRLIKWVKKINPDMIHIHTPVTIGWLGIVCAKLLKKPVVTTYHTLMEEYFEIYFLPKKLKKSEKVKYFSKKLIRKYTKFFFNRSDYITSPSIAIKKILEDCGVKKPIFVNPTGIETDYFKKISPTSKKEKIVLWVGRLGKEKNLNILLEAFKEVQKKVENAKLIIIGDGPERKTLEKTAKKLGINAEFKGYVKREGLVKYYSTAWILVSPSVTETQGLTILEAFSCSCPVVVANALGFRDFVEDGKNGFFAKPNDTDDFAKKIIKILKNPSLREKLGKNARKTAKKYDIEKQAKKFVKIYEKLIKEKSCL